MADRKSSSGMGSGGMVSKIEAARIATAAGIDLAIISGHGPHALARFTHTGHGTVRSEEHTSELQSLMRISYAVFCLQDKTLHPHAALISLAEPSEKRATAWRPNMTEVVYPFSIGRT